MKKVTFLVLSMAILTPLTYLMLQGINNLVWWVKGLQVDSDTPEYKKRKTMLMIMSVPVALTILFFL